MSIDGLSTSAPDRGTVVELAAAGPYHRPRELSAITAQTVVDDLRGAWVAIERIRRGLVDGEVFWRVGGRVEAAASLAAANDLIRGVGEWIARETM